MSTPLVKNIAASVKNRLLAAARQSGKPFQTLLTHYGLERFLFRLSLSPLKEKFILKGGLLLVGMGLPLARTTRDIDFLGLAPSDIDTIDALIREIGNLPLDDGLVYEVNELSTETMAEDTEYPGIRLKFDAWLGKARIPLIHKTEPFQSSSCYLLWLAPIRRATGGNLRNIKLSAKSSIICQ